MIILDGDKLALARSQTRQAIIDLPEPYTLAFISREAGISVANLSHFKHSGSMSEFNIAKVQQALLKHGLIRDDKGRGEKEILAANS